MAATNCQAINYRNSANNHHHRSYFEIDNDTAPEPSTSVPLSNYGTTSENRFPRNCYNRFFDFSKTDDSSTYRCCFGLIHVRRAAILISTLKILLLFSIFCRQLSRTVEVYNYSTLTRRNQHEKEELELMFSNVTLEAVEDEVVGAFLESSNQTQNRRKIGYISCVSSLLAIDDLDESGKKLRRSPEDLLPLLISTSFFSCEFLAALSLYVGLWRRRWRWLQWHIDLHVVSAAACSLVVLLLIVVFVLTFTSRFAYSSNNNEKSNPPARRLCTFFHRHISFGALERIREEDMNVKEKLRHGENVDENDQNDRITRVIVGILIVLITANVGVEIWSFRVVRACQSYLKRSRRYAKSQWPKRSCRGKSALDNLRRRTSSLDTGVINSDPSRATTIFGAANETEDAEALLSPTAHGENSSRSPLTTSPSPENLQLGEDVDKIAPVDDIALFSDNVSGSEGESGGEDETEGFVRRENNIQIHFNRSACDSSSEHSK